MRNRLEGATFAQLPRPVWNTDCKGSDPYRVRKALEREIAAQERRAPRRYVASRKEELDQWLKQNPWARISPDVLGMI